METTTHPKRSTMPYTYIITTTTPGLVHGKRSPNPTHSLAATHAVATLEEARDVTTDIAGRAAEGSGVDGIVLADSISDLPESGGTIGPLPDGTVIEVRPVRR